MGLNKKQQKIVEQLERRVRSGDLAVETRFPYHPHVTIAHDVPEADMDRALAELADYRADLTVRSMSLHVTSADEPTATKTSSHVAARFPQTIERCTAR